MAFSLSVSPAHGWREETYWPEDAAAICLLNIKGSDPETAAFFSHFIGRYADTGLPKFVQQNLTFLLSGEVMALLAHGDGGRAEYAVMLDSVKERLEVTLPGKGMKISINPKNPEGMDKVYRWLFTLLLDELISAEGTELMTARYEGCEVTFNPEAGGGAFAAYSLVQDRAVLGSSVGIVKRIATGIGGTAGDAISPLRKKYGERLKSAKIGLIVLTSLDDRVAEDLGLNNSDVGRSLADMKGLVDAVVITIDAVGEKGLKGRAEFLPVDGVELKPVSERVGFLDQALKKELEGDGLKVETEQSSGEAAVILNIAISEAVK